MKKIGRPSLGETKKVSLTLPPDLWDKLVTLQMINGMSQSELIRAILTDKLK